MNAPLHRKPDEPPSAPLSSPRGSGNAGRWRALWQTVGATGIARVVSAIFTLAQVPVVIHALGTNAFGFLSTIFALSSLVNFAGLGCGSVLQTMLADAFGRDDESLLRRRFATGFALHLALSAFWLVLLLPASRLFPWNRWLQLDAATLPLADTGMVMAWLALCIGLPLTTVPSLALAVRKGWIPPLWTALSNVAAWAAYLAAAKAGAGFGVFAVITCFAPVFANAGAGIHLLVLTRQLCFSHRDLDRKEAAALCRGSSLYAAPQIATGFLNAGLPCLLSSAGGPAAVAMYQVTQRIFGLVVQAHAIVIMPFWPAYAEAHARGDTAWVRLAFKHLMRITVFAFLPLLVLAAAGMPALLHLWIGNSAAVPATAFLLCMCAWSLVQIGGLCFQTLLLGLGKLRALAQHITAGAVAALVLMLLFARWWGAEGVLAGAVIGYTGAGLVGMGLAVRSSLSDLK